MYATEVAEIDCDRAKYQYRVRTADARTISVVLALDDSDDYAIVTTFQE